MVSHTISSLGCAESQVELYFCWLVQDLIPHRQADAGVGGDHSVRAYLRAHCHLLIETANVDSMERRVAIADAKRLYMI